MPATSSASPTKPGIIERLLEWPSTRALLMCGMLIPVVLIGALALGSAMTPGYSQLADTLSDLAEQNRPHAIVMRLGMVICGMLAIAFVAGLRRVIPVRQQRHAIALYGIGVFAILSGVFQDFGPDPGGPRNAEGYIHTIAATGLILMILAGMLATFRSGVGLLRRLSGILLTLATIEGFFFLFGQNRFEGLAQRGIFLAASVWLVAIAGTALRVEAADHQSMENVR